MAALHVPEAGLSLRRANSPDSDLPSTKPVQILRLNLAQSTLDQLIQSLHNDQKARIRLGKSHTLYYGANKSQHFHSIPQTTCSEVYSLPPDNHHDDNTTSSHPKESLYFTGLLSHSLEVQKAKEATASTDQALATLEQSLHAFEQGKESKKTPVISDDELKYLNKSGNKSLSRPPATRLDLEKDRLSKNNASSLSLPPSLGASPLSLSATRTPPPTSAPMPTPAQNKERIRLDALKVPFIHLLAVRAVSPAYLARKTRSSLDDCWNLVRKYCMENRLDREKFDLKDRTYRELDIWGFPYPSEEDRHEAIENAISAFDRMRISRSDNLWQMLLPKEERGKGKVLSRLDLRTGPIKKAVTPRIHVSDENGGGGGDDLNGNHSNNHHLSPSNSATVPHKKGTGSGEKEATKRAQAKTKHSNNSTLTGRVTKKTEKKPTSSKFKSAEFVHDSDEDDDVDMQDASTSQSASSASQQHLRPQASPANNHTGNNHTGGNNNNNKHKHNNNIHNNNINNDYGDKGVEHKASSSHHVASKVGKAKTQTDHGTGSHKPSPSILPTKTNTSNRGHSRSSSGNTGSTSSSSSSSPLITQISKQRKTKEKEAMESTKSSILSTTPRPAKPVNGTTNHESKKEKTMVPSKRPAESHDTKPHGGRQQQHLHQHQHQQHSANGNTDVKRRRAISSSSDSTSGSSPSLSREILLGQLQEKARHFKQSYAKYRSLYDSLASHADPPQADVDRLQQQHYQLQRVKKEIWDEDRRIREGTS